MCVYIYGQCHRGRVTCIAVGKEFYFTAGDDGAMRVWNRRNLEFIGQYSEHTKTVTGQFQYLHFCLVNGRHSVWNRRNLEFIDQYSEHTNTVTGATKGLSRLY